MLLLASYVFYSAWDWRFLSLILFSTVVNYFCGLKIHASEEIRTRKFYLTVSLVSNLAVLGFFKYYNFFVDNFNNLLSMANTSAHIPTLNIILPLGISFFTLQSLSYTIDIYRKGMKPTHDFISFALFVAFFPQLVAGPIERARNLLPQMLSKRTIKLDQFYEGGYLFFWGLFLKVFIADNLANIVTPIFAASPPYNGLEVLMGMYAFTIQIYCDFKGYSCMARGLAKMMGFELMLNFDLPYFVTNIQDFWNKWHISLSTWVRDYIYMPIFFGMRNVGPNLRISIVLIITMAIMGLWHGANWIFIGWGLYHGVLLVAYMFIKNHCSHWVQPKTPAGEKIWTGIRIFFMFHVVAYGMLIFRAQWGRQIIDMTQAMFLNFSWFTGAAATIWHIIGYSAILFIVQFIQYTKKDLTVVFKSYVPVRVCFYYLCLILLTFYGDFGSDEFIYFQF